MNSRGSLHSTTLIRSPVIVRDPITGAIVSGLGLTAGSIGAALVGIAVNLVVSAVVSWALGKLQPDVGARGMLTNVREAAAPHEYVFGRVRKGGVVTYLEATGSSNKFLHMILCLAGHEVEEISDIYINDEVVTLDGSGFVTSEPWDSKIRIRKHLGDQVAADADLLAETAQIDSSFVGHGIAYLYIRLEYDKNVFSNGIPLFTAVVKGAKPHDPRSGTAAWTANAALCTRHYLVSGFGLDDPLIDDTAFQAAANVCDEAVALSGGGAQSRYEINGAISADMAPSQILQSMMTAQAGTLFWGGGRWQLRPGYYTAPVKTLTQADLRSAISLDTRVSRRDNYNIVRGVFNDADQDWVQADYPEIASAAFIAEDNDAENAIDFELPLTTDAAMAQRLAKLTLFRGREQMTFSADFSLAAFDLEPGDIVALNIDRFGWASKEFEVTGWRFYADQDASDLRVNLILRETSASAFSWLAEESDIIANNTSLLGAGDIPVPVLGVQLAVRFFRNQAQEVVLLTTSVGDASLVDQIEFEYKRNADSDWIPLGRGGVGEFIVPDMTPGVYDFRARSVAPWGAVGPWDTETGFTVDFLEDYRSVWNGRFASGDFTGWQLEIYDGSLGGFDEVSELTVVQRNAGASEDAIRYAPTPNVVQIDWGDNATGIGAYNRLIWSGLIPVQPGADVYASFRYAAGDGSTYSGVGANGCTVRATLRWYDEDGVQLSAPDDETDDYFSTAIAPLPGDGFWKIWQRSAIPPAQAAFCRPVLETYRGIGLAFVADMEVDVALNTARITRDGITEEAETAVSAISLAVNNVEETVVTETAIVPEISSGTTGEALTIDAAVSGNVDFTSAGEVTIRLYIDGVNVASGKLSSDGPFSLSAISQKTAGEYDVELRASSPDVTAFSFTEARARALVLKR